MIDFQENELNETNDIVEIELNQLLIELKKFRSESISKYNIDFREMFSSEKIVIKGLRIQLAKALLSVIDIAIDNSNKKIFKLMTYKASKHGVVIVITNGVECFTDCESTVLELSMARDYMNKNHGILNIYSSLERTVFILKLPIN